MLGISFKHFKIIHFWQTLRHKGRAIYSINMDLIYFILYLNLITQTDAEVRSLSGGHDCT